MSKTNKGTTEWAATTSRNSIHLAWWTAAWVVSMAVATFGPLLVWDSNKLLSIAAVLVNLAIGIGMIVANKRHLQGLDEMHQRIQLEAMALSLGVSLVVGLSYSVLDTSELITFDAEISHLVITMSLTYMAGIFAGHRRYR